MAFSIKLQFLNKYWFQNSAFPWPFNSYCQKDVSKVESTSNRIILANYQLG